MIFARSGFKIPDQVHGQGVKPIEKGVVLSIHDGLVCEHLSEAVLHLAI